MIELNKILLSGRLTRDPELKFIPSGTAVCEMRVAAGRSFYDKNAGEKREETLFINVTAWGKTAEFCDKYFQKGKGIFVEGRLKQDQWERDGQKHERISVVADRVQFAESKAAESAGGGGSRGDYREPAHSAPQGGGGGGGGGSAPPSNGGGTNDDLPF